MNKVILYKQGNGGVAIIRPTAEALALYGIDAIAQKDVPSGKLYKIIDANELPADRTFRAAWDIDDALLTDGIGAEWSTFDEGSVQP